MTQNTLYEFDPDTYAILSTDSTTSGLQERTLAAQNEGVVLDTNSWDACYDGAVEVSVLDGTRYIDMYRMYAPTDEHYDFTQFMEATNVTSLDIISAIGLSDDLSQGHSTVSEGSNAVNSDNRAFHTLGTSCPGVVGVGTSEPVDAGDTGSDEQKGAWMPPNSAVSIEDVPWIVLGVGGAVLCGAAACWCRTYRRKRGRDAESKLNTAVMGDRKTPAPPQKRAPKPQPSEETAQCQSPGQGLPPRLYTPPSENKDIELEFGEAAGATSKPAERQ